MNSIQINEDLLKKITPRQLQIVRDLAEGLSSKEISAKRGMTLKTVGTHRKQMLKRYNCRNTAHLVSAMTKGGMI